MQVFVRMSIIDNLCGNFRDQIAKRKLKSSFLVSIFGLLLVSRLYPIPMVHSMNESEAWVSVGTGVNDLSKDNSYLFKLRNLKDKEPC